MLGQVVLLVVFIAFAAAFCVALSALRSSSHKAFWLAYSLACAGLSARTLLTSRVWSLAQVDFLAVSPTASISLVVSLLTLACALALRRETIRTEGTHPSQERPALHGPEAAS